MSINSTLAAMEAVEQRAFAARITISDLCERARVHQSVWSRAKKRQTIRVKVLDRIEAALTSVEQDRSQSDAAGSRAAAQHEERV
jgi:hypothetical protein